MKHPRRRFLKLKLACVAAAASALPRQALALDYPTRPVRLVVGFPPGGQQDIMARLIGQWLSERLAQQFLVENRSGAGGNIAAEAVINSPPDGYTMLKVSPLVEGQRSYIRKILANPVVVHSRVSG